MSKFSYNHHEIVFSCNLYQTLPTHRSCTALVFTSALHEAQLRQSCTHCGVETKFEIPAKRAGGAVSVAACEPSVLT